MKRLALQATAVVRQSENNPAFALTYQQMRQMHSHLNIIFADMMNMIKTLLYIGAGSFIGGIARFLLSRAIHSWWAPAGFPAGTFTVNILGCLLIGIFYGISERYGILSSDMRLFLTVGLCGGFTTFSTFAYESLGMLNSGNMLNFVIYPTLSFVAGLLSAYFGNLIIRIL